jgi:predicted  nucleic acid-binding Zn-ribbon protein
MHKTNTVKLIAALRILARDIESDDGVANMAIAEAADRMEEMQTMIDGLSGTIDSQKQTFDALHKKLEAAVTDAEDAQWKAAKLEAHARALQEEKQASIDLAKPRTSRPTLDQTYP